ncbi:MAG: glycosyltransferase family 1 protein [Gemmatimonadetes bacterium]|nr:glycosyltransferase family 1 protein [Gemmatimonadota bacterium]
MRLLVCTDSYPPQLNGVSVITALTVHGLQARGWQCEVVAPRYPAGPGVALAPDPSVPVIGVPSVPLPGYRDVRVSLPALRRVEAAVRRFAPDLVHCATEFVVGRLGMAAARRAGVPVVTSYHTDFARYTAMYGIPWMRRPVAAWLSRFHANSALTLTPSEAAREDLHALGGRDAAVWGRGIDTEAFHPRHRSNAVRERLAPGASFLLLYAGRLAPEKNVGVLLEAFGALARTLPPGAAHLLVAGDGPSLPGLRRQAGPQVTFVGPVDRTRDLPALYASCDAFVFASATETLGLVVLEAMASGVPVIAVPAGGVSEHLVHERNGLAVRDGDVGGFVAAMQRLHFDQALRSGLATGARRSAQAVGWEAELDRLDVLLRDVRAM